MSSFPLLILITAPHGLEPAAIAGTDYDAYLICEDIKDLPNNIPFKILQTNFTGHSVRREQCQ